MTPETLGRRFAEENGITVAPFADFFYLCTLPPDLAAYGDNVYCDESEAYRSLGNAITPEPE